MFEYNFMKGNEVKYNLKIIVFHFLNLERDIYIQKGF